MDKSVISSEIIVSVIMPAYNSARTIAESVQSVLNQTFGAWELIIVDDFSQDNTVQLINEFIKQDKRIRMIALPKNGGLSNARNTGIELSKAKYITFLDADDLWHNLKLEKQIELHKQNPRFRISHTNYDFVINGIISPRKSGRIFDWLYEKRGELYPQILYKNNIAILSVMVERNLIETSGGFDSGLWAFEDQDLWIKISKQNSEFGYLDEKLSFYRVNPNGMSNSIGKYKCAYKFFINKYAKELLLTNKMLDAKSIYSNYFGLQFFKRGEFQLAFLYLIKAWRIKWFSILNILFLGYLIKSFLQMHVSLKRKKNVW